MAQTTNVSYSEVAEAKIKALADWVPSEDGLPCMLLATFLIYSHPSDHPLTGTHFGDLI